MPAAGTLKTLTPSRGPDRPAASRPWEFGVAYVDGVFVPAGRAAVSIYDHSFLYGDGVFETVLVRNGRSFRLTGHLERLEASAAYLQISVSLGRDELAALVADLIARNELRAGFVRLVLSRGPGYPASDPRKATRPTLVLSAQEQPPLVVGEHGLRLIVAQTRRTPPQSLDPRVKTNNYGNHIVAKLEAIAAGVDDAILLDQSGSVAELPGSNMFVVSRGQLATPSPGNLLNGITRAALLEIAGEVDSLAVAERPLAPSDLLSADEVFVTGTGTGVGFVSEIDGVRVGDATLGPVTRKLRERYERLIDDETGGGKTTN